MCVHYGFKKEILNFYDPNKGTESTSEFILPKIEDEINNIFDTEEEEDKQDKPEEDPYFSNYTNMNCYKYSEKLYNAFMKAFSYLPIGAIINKTSICLHGGLSPLLEKVDDIRDEIKCPITDFDENLLLSDILWGDPSETLTTMYSTNQRGRGKIFSGAVVVNFLKKNNLKRLIRGHECVECGIDEQFNSKCITVFSASSYSGALKNSCGILRIYENDDKIEPVIFPPLKRLKKCDTSYYRVQSLAKNKAHNTKLPQIQICQNELLPLSFHQVSCSFENMNIHYITSAKRIANEKTNIQLNSKPRKRFSCIFSNPHILVPHVNKN